MRNYTEEQLMAYADGELPAAAAQAIARDAQSDPQLARRIARYATTRRLLQETFGGRVDEPVPERLRRAARGPTSPRVMALRRRWRPRVWIPAALAAALALAVSLSVLQQRPQDTGAQTVGLPYTAATLSRALETLASGVPAQGESRGQGYEILPVSSLLTDEGYCREFESVVLAEPAPQRAHGLACREADGHWKLRALVAAAAPAYVPAQGRESARHALLENAERLSLQDERRLIDHSWNDAAR
jgi:surface antigen